MKVLVYGANGWIGQQFIEILKQNVDTIEYVLGKARVDNDAALLDEIETVLPTHVVSFIGRTHGKIVIVWRYRYHGEIVITTYCSQINEGKKLDVFI